MRGGRAGAYVELPRFAGELFIEASFVVPSPSPGAGRMRKTTFRVVSGVRRLGNAQEGRAGARLPDKLEVRLVDGEGAPIAGARVRFVLEGRARGAKVSPAEVPTDAKGFARAQLVLPEHTGRVAVRAEIRHARCGALSVPFRAMAVDPWAVAFGLIGGLAIFIYGMRLMSQGLQRVAGQRLRTILRIFTQNRFVAMLVGAGVTALIQSSSACTVMLVGFVNAGLVSLAQAIGVVFGANIGTTATAQIIAFKIQEAALPAIAAGFVMTLVGRREAIRNWGLAVLGFGLLFLGLTTMSGTLGPLRESYTFQRFFQTFDCGPSGGALMRPDRVLGAIAIGTALTLLIQSSSATVGLTQALAGSGLVNFYTAVPLILGTNIGTTITAILASLGGNRAAKQTACAHTLFNIFGTTYMVLLFFVRWGGEPIFLAFVDRVTPGQVMGPGLLRAENIERHIAMAHTFFNVFNAILFLPFVGFLAVVCQKIIPSAEKERVTRLEPHLLDTPEIALEQARGELVRTARLARSFLEEAYGAFRAGSAKDLGRIGAREEEIDHLQEEITNYLVDLSRRDLRDREAERLQVILHAVNDLERVGDLAENICEFAARRAAARLPLSEEALADLDRLYGEVKLQFDEVLAAMETGDVSQARSAMRREDAIDEMVEEMDARHIARLRERRCHIRAGILFRDLVGTFEKVGDHLDNVGEAWADLAG